MGNNTATLAGLIIIGGAAWALSGTATQATTPPPPPQNKKYAMINVLTWGTVGFAGVDWTKISEISIFNVNIDATGSGLTFDGNGFTNYAGAVSIAHANGANCTVCIGGSGLPVANLNAAIANPNAFVTSMMDLVNKYGFDGVQIDFEAPFNGSGYPAFLSACRAALNHVGKYLTVTYADWEKGTFTLSSIQGSCDKILNMVYPQSATGASVFASTVAADAAQLSNPAQMQIGFDLSKVSTTALQGFLQALNGSYGTFYWNTTIANQSFYTIIDDYA